MTSNERTKEDSSKEQYLKIANRHLNEFQSLNNVSHIDWDSYLSFLDEKQSTISIATWRLFKASNVYMLEELGEFFYADKLKQFPNTVALRKTTATSAKKQKSIPVAKDMEILKDLLARSKKEGGRGWYRVLMAFYITIRKTGMRPSEIKTASFINTHSGLIGHTLILRIKNGKATNQRSFGQFRHISLDKLSEKDILYIKFAIETANNKKCPLTGEIFDEEYFYERLRKRFQYVVKKLFPNAKKNISLYSCRHQLIADLKHNGYALNEISAVVGHGNDLTATEHYGRKKYGATTAGLPVPSSIEVQKIRLLYDSKSQKQANYKDLKNEQARSK